MFLNGVDKSDHQGMLQGVVIFEVSLLITIGMVHACKTFSLNLGDGISLINGNGLIQNPRCFNTGIYSPNEAILE